jgi:hypothetical protein
MMRFFVRVAFGLVALSIAPSIAMAQVARDAGSMGAGQPGRSFSRISFGGTPFAPGVGSRLPGGMDVLLGGAGARLPEVTTAPEPHGLLPDCVMRVVPVDPRAKSSMPVVSVDGSIDLKAIIKVPECRPRK